jgi:hypothetical protein
MPLCEDGSVGRRRWDIDERGHGVASGQAFVPNVAELEAAMGDPGWVTEDPETHLLPHLEAACSEGDAPLHIASFRSEGEVFVVELEARDGSDSIGQLRRAAVALAATIAEESTHIRQGRKAGVVEFEVATGSVASESRFAAHGHLVRLRIPIPSS